ncbi:hypothetical protein BDV96DRAFT_120871 [Lophiotrema nucula]|uniref:Uncharacterized protein n=1 Tax=Lophiotrema nucula TaxID=690887 RepID=A0A6A5Z4F0_9PLEO|nr:hypothetical protein BDV96DRAFT_120871 [Lophiotrema nucula]
MHDKTTDLGCEGTVITNYALNHPINVAVRARLTRLEKVRKFFRLIDQGRARSLTASSPKSDCYVICGIGHATRRFCGIRQCVAIASRETRVRRGNARIAWEAVEAFVLRRRLTPHGSFLDSQSHSGTASCCRLSLHHCSPNSDSLHPTSHRLTSRAIVHRR